MTKKTKVLKERNKIKENNREGGERKREEADRWYPRTAVSRFSGPLRSVSFSVRTVSHKWRSTQSSVLKY
jgi:hypothetical protein